MSKPDQEVRRPTEIRVRPRHRRDLGDLGSLKESISKIGLLHPVVISPTGLLIAGERRLKAIRDLKWDWVPVRVVHSLDDALKALEAERDENTCRKDFAPSEAVALARDLEPLERESAKARQAAAGPSTGKGRKSIGVGKLPEPVKGRAKEKIAKAVGVARRTLDKAQKVVEAAERDPGKYTSLRDQMDKTGNVHGAYRKLEQDNRRLERPSKPLPSGSYRLIYADPPWKYEHVETESRSIENQYPTMDLKDICNLKIPAADDSVLFLWATSPKLAEALQVMDAWGFSYRTCAVWDKVKMGMGYYFRQQHELLLVGARGALPVPHPSDRPASLFRVKRGRHSEKPSRVYKLIESMYPAFTADDRIELFARETRAGWAKPWSNEPAVAS